MSAQGAVLTYSSMRHIWIRGALLCHCIPFPVTIPIAVAINIPITIRRSDLITINSLSFSDCYADGCSFPVPIIRARGTNCVAISIPRSRWSDPPAHCRHVRPVLWVRVDDTRRNDPWRRGL